MVVTLELAEAADVLAQLGNQTRLQIVRILVKAGDVGMPVGDIQQRVQVPASTLSHHLQHLKSAGLISQTRESNVLRCKAQYSRLNQIGAYLLSECCTEG